MLAAAVRTFAAAVRTLAPRRPWHIALTCFASGLVLAESPPGVPLLVSALAAAALLWLRAPRLAVGAAALLLAGAAVGDLRLETIDRFADRIEDGEYVHLTAHLLSPPQASPFGEAAEVEVVGERSSAVRLRGARLLARAPRWAPFPPSLAVGEELALRGTLRELRLGAASASAPSRDPPFDFAAHLRRRGVAGELLLDRVRATGRRRGGLAGLLDRMRERARRAVVAGLPHERAALLLGMVLGDDAGIDRATRDDWRDAGLAHLLAVSGQNVMLLAALALPLLMLVRAGLRVRLITLAALIAVYVPLAGAGPSLQRAGIMGLAGIAAIAASRPASRWYALLLAATVTLLWNPRTWTDPGWQLSFAAVAGILGIGVPLQRTLRRAVDELSPAREPPPQRASRGGSPTIEPPATRAAALGEQVPLADSRRALPAHGLRRAALGTLADGLAITLSATLATAPLGAHHFGYLPLAGLPANLVALPAVAPAMWLGMLKAALGQLAGPGAPGVAGPPAAAGALGTAGALGAAAALGVAGALGSIASLPVGFLATLAERFADLPGGRVSLPLRSPAAVLGCYAALALAALAVHRSLAARVPGHLPVWASAWRAASPPRRRALLALVLTLTFLLAGAVLVGPGPPTRLTVRFLDVGQGDAVLIQHPDGTAVLFDGGPPEGGVVRLLRRAGVARLALVVATHASRDHHGGLPAVLRRFPVDTLLDGGDGTADPSFEALASLADERGIRRVRAIAPLTLTLASGDLTIDVLSPPPRAPGPAPEDPNPRAVVAIVRSRGFALFLSADAESEALLPLDLPDVDAIKVPHHGSSDPGLPEVLERLQPELAAIEVGRHNTYGHPTPQTLAALERARVATYRTDRDGTITLTPAEDGVRVATER